MLSFNAELTRAHSQFFEALRSRQADLVIEIIHDQFFFINADGMLMDRECFLERFVNKPAFTFQSIEIRNIQVIELDQTAVLTGVLYLSLLTEGGQKKFAERITETFVKQNNEWKLLAFQGTFVNA